MIHIQIQQGKPLSEGAIDEETLEWMDLEDIRFDQEATNREKELTFKMVNDGGEESVLKSSEDYGSFTMKSHIFHLDDLVVPTNYVVTGTSVSH